jgi:Zn-dependent protease
MRPSIRLGTFAGIKIGLHWSIAVIAVLITMSLAGTVLPFYAPGYGGASYLAVALLTAGLFLVSIVAHELGHSLVAESSGVRVRGITLFALGGVASLGSEPPSPGAAARIAIAGPAVSAVIGAGSLVTAAVGATLGLPVLVTAGLAWLGVINLVLAAFNLLPALPLDGGRVLQAALWKHHGDRHRATISAATIGGYIGWVLVGLGLLQLLSGGGGIWTMLIGGFVIMTAKAEGFRARLAQQHASGRPTFGPFVVWHRGPAAPSPAPPRPPWHDDTVVEVDGRPVDG